MKNLSANARLTRHKRLNADCVPIKPYDLEAESDATGHIKLV